MYKIKTGLSQEEKSYAEKLEALVVSGKRVSTIDEYSLRGALFDDTSSRRYR